jgi:hypothetical protein
MKQRVVWDSSDLNYMMVAIRMGAEVEPESGRIVLLVVWAFIAP